MRFAKTLYVLLIAMVLTGCVSSKTYKAKLAEISDLEGQVLALQEELKANREKYGEETALLNQKIADLRESEKSLMEANSRLSHRMEANKMELVKEATELENRIKEMELDAKSLREEVAVLQDTLAERDRRILELTAKAAELEAEKTKAIEAKKEAVAELQGTYDELVGELNDEIEKGRIAVTQLKDKLSLSMVDKILFDSGSAEVNREGKKVLDRVAEILVKVKDKQIRIEGHTDNVSIGASLREKFPTNWELSTARASNVVRYLQEEGGIDPHLLSVAGYSEYQPVASNETAEGKARNRRIEIVLTPMDIDRMAAEDMSGEGHEETGTETEPATQTE